MTRDSASAAQSVPAELSVEERANLERWKAVYWISCRFAGEDAGRILDRFNFCSFLILRGTLTDE